MAGGVQRRSIAIPLVLSSAEARRAVLCVARALSAGADAEAERAARALLDSAREERGAPEADADAALDLLRGAALARVLVDLAEAGWELSVLGTNLTAHAPVYEGASPTSLEELLALKAAVRRAMAARVREQVASPSMRRLVEEVEGQEGALRAVLAAGAALDQALHDQGAAAIRPRLELARREDGADPISGVSRYAIFRYLRTLWSFPYGDTPGRSLPLLLRDDGQPGSPICGLLCLSSPVLRLTVRDDALGLTPAWLEAVVAGLQVVAIPGDRADLRARLLALEGALGAARAASGTGPAPQQVMADLALLLRLGEGATRLAAQLSALGEPEREARAEQAARRLAGELVQELHDAIHSVSLEGLGWEHAALLQRPDDAAAELARRAQAARAEWVRTREHEHASRGAALEHQPGDRAAPALSGEHRRLRELSNQHLFVKKRALKLSGLLSAWGGLRELREALAQDAPMLAALASLTLAGDPTGGGRPALRGGQAVDRSLALALTERKVRVAASQVVDVSLCGAVPPYNRVLGGKLAALAALSADVAELYASVYANRASDIQSRMSGAEVVRPTELLALTTTSFYEVASAQYTRLRLPGGLRWEEVGRSRGHGSLHLSREAGALLDELLVATSGRRLITSTFGEGPSERLRKLRDGLGLLGLDADALLQHGMPRIVYVARRSPATRPGVSTERGDAPAPRLAEVAAEWRRRWLEPRLATILSEGALRAEEPEQVLLSARFPAELGRSARLGAEPAREAS